MLSVRGQAPPSAVVKEQLLRARLLHKYLTLAESERAEALRRDLEHALDEAGPGEEAACTIQLLYSLLQGMGSSLTGAPTSAPARAVAKAEQAGPQTPPPRRKLYDSPSAEKASPGAGGSEPAAPEPDRMERLLTALEKWSPAERGKSVGAEQRRQSAFRYHPNVEWPVLNDAERDVRWFWMEFRETCSLVVGGGKMEPQEQLVCVKSCLKQSYADVYRVVVDEARESGTMSDDPLAVVTLLETRTMAFQRSLLDQQSLADKEWDVIQKDARTGLQWQPIFEKTLAKLNRLGLAKSERDIFLGYLRKIGSDYKKVIMKDRREYPVEGGGSCFRGPQTWREAHAILLEEETLSADAKSLVAGVESSEPSGAPHAAADAAAAAVGPNDAKAASQAARTAALAAGASKKEAKKVVRGAIAAAFSSTATSVDTSALPCFEARDNNGRCSRQGCHFSDDPKVLAQARADLKKLRIEPKASAKSKADGKKKKEKEKSDELCRQFIAASAETSAATRTLSRRRRPTWRPSCAAPLPRRRLASRSSLAWTPGLGRPAAGHSRGLPPSTRPLRLQRSPGRVRPRRAPRCRRASSGSALWVRCSLPEPTQLESSATSRGTAPWLPRSRCLTCGAASTGRARFQMRRGRRLRNRRPGTNS